MKSQSQQNKSKYLTDHLFPDIQGNNQINSACIENKQSIQFCVNGKCQILEPFICGSRGCKCQQSHKMCLKANVDYVIGKLKQKIHKIDLLAESVDNSFQKIIDQLSDLRQRIIVQIKSSIKQVNLQQIEKQFLNKVLALSQQNKQQNQGIQLNGKKLSKLWEIIQQESPKKISVVEATLNQIQIFKSSIQKLSYDTQSTINGFCKNKQQISQFNLVYEFLKKSSIIKSNDHAQRLLKFFPKKINKLQFIYKASENDYSLKSFYQKCQTSMNNLIVCKTAHDKIIGGYTPLNFNPKNITGYAADFSNTSFLFSLTENDKFQLKNNKQAIYLVNSQNFVCFGNNLGQLAICDHANKKTGSLARINKSYKNPNYKSQDKDSNKKFTGSETHQFMIKQWQFWTAVPDQ